jgi:2-keto-4-pentenoate hydratase
LADEGRGLESTDLYTAGMVMEVNGEIASVGVGAAALGHPLNAAAWLARTLAARANPCARATFCWRALGPMVALTTGDHVVARVGGLGACSFTYTKG